MPTFQNTANSNHEQQIILLMVPNGDRCHYLAVKKFCIITRNNVKT